MPTAEKEAAIAEMTERLKASEIAIATNYTGMNVAQATDLRNQLRQAGVEFKIYKNTLAKIALKNHGVEEAGDFIDGATAWAFSTDPVAPAKVLKDFGKEVKFVKMTGGVLSGKPVSADELFALADLPPREALLSQIAGLFEAPMSQMAALLNALPQQTAGLIDALETKRKDGAA